MSDHLELDPEWIAPNASLPPGAAAGTSSLVAAPLLCEKCGIPLVPSRAVPGFYAHVQRTEFRHYAKPFRVRAE